MQKLMISTALCLVAAAAWGKDASYIGGVHVVPGEGGETARGTVFLDENRNSVFDEGEQGIAGVQVSNGREVVLSGDDGSYALPAYEDMNLFITKPADYAVPVDEVMVPQFNYVHKIAGSPDLRYGGIAPTGPLPAEVNFPLIEDEVGEAFSCLVFGDAQPYSNREIGYVRDTAGRMLANRDNDGTECLIFEGDVMGDDLSLYPRFKQIISVGETPQYFVAGNHDLDFDAEDDQHSFDTFRREWGPEYYSFDIGNVHFVVLDNVRYPCNGVDDHPFCDPAEDPDYNGVIHDRQLTWLENDLANVPEDKLIVINTHIPLVTFTDNEAQKHQTDNLDELYAILGERPALGLSGHTHTTEQILIDDHYEGWEENTGTGPAQFHQIVTGGLSGSWWIGDLNDDGIPHGTQRLGSPRGYYRIDFNGSDYTDTYLTFTGDESEQMHASFNTPRFRDWATALLAYAEIYDVPTDVTPPVTINDLGDMYMLTTEDLEEGTWVAVNVWNGSGDSTVEVSINGGEPLVGERTQTATGEEKNRGPEFADPLAMARQSTNGRMTVRSAQGGDDTAGFQSWQGTQWTGVAGPFRRWMLTDNSNHLWRVDLPADLPVGVHMMEVRTVDRYGREYTLSQPFEIVEELPPLDWQDWEEASE
ncbi:calcineurin-like phosphoesterase C-terminal domain-containing protein [Pontivivens ytuae]|uniref:Calcineurin-like phosphoesterase C-terminal domain-containing protein n=1 Tax=Pontivivens ytuae TaxID=2789856 RepID=A0A7S9LSZ1_9RHOB|nr:calcineurin-like phosphoesterase family protein [Pontivivens ytuae]QPH54150.1 calcineurin-like phosphoesterase C-terminal domain-containing protein [Pontivivens ytuae]